MTVLIAHSDTSLTTSGLTRYVHREIRLRVDDSKFRSEGEALLRYMADYIVGSRASILSSETMLYGYWLVKFTAAEDGALDIWEYDATATNFIEGATLGLTYWRDQHEVCRRAGAVFQPPRPDQMVVVSKGVLEGATVKGVRYPSTEHMSGWWLVTDQYDGKVESMRNEHLYHLTATRPDLARYVALPVGFRFDLSNGEDVWLDQAVRTG
jgi:hypothetical protein